MKYDIFGINLAPFIIKNVMFELMHNAPKERTVRGAFWFLFKRIFEDGGVLITCLAKMFDEKGPAKLHFLIVSKADEKFGRPLMLIESH